MLDLLGKLIKRLDEVNDGSFDIDDRETERVKNL
jgi:ATP-dependent RNA helicase